jgi:hypothetical protein
MAPDDNEKRAAEPDARDEELNARQEMDRLAEADEVPTDPRDWPGGKAKFLSFGDGGDRYGEGATAKLGPAEVRHHAGGSVSVGGEQVDNPEDFKGEPIPGGPTDPNSPELAGSASGGPVARAPGTTPTRSVPLRC